MKINTTKVTQITKNKLFVPIAALVLTAGAVTGVVGIAHADSSTATGTTQLASGHTGMRGTPPAAVGKVTAVNGDSITLTDLKNSTTYTVDATNATITERTKPTTPSTAGTRPAPATISVSQVAVGDMLAVQGTVNGTTITATKIEDGIYAMGATGGGRMGGFGGHGGFGGSGVRGMVTAVNGSTVTVTGMDGKSYTVDASNSTVGKLQTVPVSSIQVGDSVGIQGTISGTSVTAKSIMDGMPTHVAPAPAS